MYTDEQIGAGLARAIELGHWRVVDPAHPETIFGPAIGQKPDAKEGGR